MNYYKDRATAGRLLADQLKNYRFESCALIALSEGAVLIAAEIAKKMHGTIFIFTTDEIDDENKEAMTALTSQGMFSFTTGYALGQLEEDMDAWRFFTDQRNLNEFQRLNHIAGKDGTIPKTLLKHHVVILVSEGIHSALSVKVASHFLHPVELKKLILATPIASSDAIDRMHENVDQIFCLRSVDNYISAGHYYEKNDIPDEKTVVEVMQNIVFNWERPDTK